MLAIAILTARKNIGRIRRLELRNVVLVVVVGAVALWSVTRVSQLDRSLQRWDQAEKTMSQDARWLVDKAALAAIPAAGWSGFGPGTFSVVFPAFNQLDSRAGGDWLFLHNDYLQTLMEWGWVGGALYGNAGAYGHSINERVVTVRFFDGERVREFDNAECRFAYRESTFKRHKEWTIFSTELVAFGYVGST